MSNEIPSQPPHSKWHHTSCDICDRMLQGQVQLGIQIGDIITIAINIFKDFSCAGQTSGKPDTY